MPPNARCTEEADVKCGNARDTRPKLGQFARQCESNIVERMRSSVTDTLLTLGPATLPCSAHNSFRPTTPPQLIFMLAFVNCVGVGLGV